MKKFSNKILKKNFNIDNTILQQIYWRVSKDKRMDEELMKSAMVKVLDYHLENLISITKEEMAYIEG